MIRKILKRLFVNTMMSDRQYADWYLSQSNDHADLERRLKELDQRGYKLY